MNTNLIEFLADGNETVKLFTNEELNINHHFKEENGKYFHTVKVGENEYNYSFSIPFYRNLLEEKRHKKRYFKLSIYKALSSFYQKSLPWGALTGIRPTKLAYSQLEETGEFFDFFTNVMCVSKDKTKLIENILQVQKGIYAKGQNYTDFFVGIPFCPSKCKYCSFVSTDISRSQGFLDDYVTAIIKEIESAKPLIKNLRSVYIGGGTPVALPTSHLEKILKAIGKQTIEYTVEAGRPDCITQDKLDLLKEYGVTRVCVNPQTFNDQTLVKLGRKHTVSDVYEKYEMVKGKFDVNMDLIAGLEDETFEDFKFSIDSAIKLNPENITVHTLCLKKGSTLKESVKRLPENEIEKMVNYAHEKLYENGYFPYYLYRQKYMAGNLENTGYAKQGKQCIYNIDIMEEIADNVACGANAVSKAVFDNCNRIERYSAPKDIKTYIDKVDKIIEEKRKLFNE